jgi:hypothetical protein
MVLEEKSIIGKIIISETYIFIQQVPSDAKEVVH